MKSNSKTLLIKSWSITAFTAVCCWFGAVQLAHSAGGGGGGSFSTPSRSAPSIDPVAKYQEGIEALKKGENRSAEKAFRKVLKVNKKHASSQYFLGVALYNQEKYKKARRPFERALKYDAELLPAHGFLGAIYHKTQKPEKAIKHKEILLDKQKACGDCEAKDKISRALKRIEVQAEGAGDQAVWLPNKLNSGFGDQQYLLAIELINKGEYAAALRSLKEAALVFGPHPDVLTYQGFANRQQGNYTEARKFYHQALSIDANHRGANEYLGEYYVELGRLDLALDQLDKLEKICAFGCEEAEELRRWIKAAG